MKNPLKTIDEYVMDTVNSIAHAWNWTTGKTNYDLAKICYISYPFIAASGCFLNNDYVLGSIWGMHSILFTPNLVKIVKKIEKLENEATEKEAYSSQASTLKRLSKVLGYMSGGLAGTVFLDPNQKEGQFSHIERAGIITSSTIYAMGCLLIAADPLPPRKSVIARTKERLTEIINAYRAQPTMQVAK